MDIVILLVLILVNGLFAMSEIALVTARKSRLQRLADNGDKAAAIAIQLGEDSTQFLSTIQIGITAIGILSGIFGEAALAGPVGDFLHQQMGLDLPTSSFVATLIVVLSITYLSIVIGELVPKRMGQFNAEGTARLIARPIALLALLSRPFVLLLSMSTNGILRLLGKGDLGNDDLTEEDIHAILAEGSQSGVIEKQEHEIVRNVFRLDDRQVVSLMTPRSEVVALDIEKPFEEGLQVLINSYLSRFPVCRGDMNDLLGVVTAKGLLKCQQKASFADIASDLLPAIYVPESLTGMKLLEQFRVSGMDMVFVVDEYGEVQGLVTLQDVLKALTGEFKPHDPDDVWASESEDGSWLLDGLIPLPELKDKLTLKNVPDEVKARYHTLSGMMMWLLGKVPQVGDMATWQGWQLQVTTLDGNRIDKVLASRLPEVKKPDTE